MRDRELDDTLAYLAPLAKAVSRRIEYRIFFQPGELYTQALIGAWEAARLYDSAQYDSLWNFARTVIKRRTWDEVRSEIGRDFSKRSRFQIVDPEEMRFISCEDHGFTNIDTRNTVGTLFERLSPRDRQVLISLYLNDATLTECGDAVGVSESRMSQIASKTRATAKRVLCNMCEGDYPIPAQQDSTLTSGGILSELSWLKD